MPALRRSTSRLLSGTTCFPSNLSIIQEAFCKCDLRPPLTLTKTANSRGDSINCIATLPSDPVSNQFKIDCAKRKVCSSSFFAGSHIPVLLHCCDSIRSRSTK